MTYLLVGYYYMNYGTYDINWTMSYCILCLRLIGLAWDYRDGNLPVESLSEYQKNAAIKRLPDPLEIASFCFMPTSCFAGPQFTWRHYQSFVNRTLRPKVVLQNRSSLQKNLLNPKLHRTLSRLSTGVICLAINIISQAYFPMEYMTTKKFLTEHSFFYRLGYMGCYSKCLIFRYLAIWLIGEGACVFLGLGCTGRVRIEYNGKKEKEEGVKNKEANDDNTLRKVAILSSNAGAGFRLESELCPEDFQAVQEGRATLVEEQHTRCANVSIVRYEFATNTDLLVSSFNINTNKWMLEDTVCCSLLAISPNPHIADSAELVSSTMAYSSPVKYLYKRLRFLGNKTISQAFTLIFLAVWHGFYSGYYINFLLEFLTIHTEKQEGACVFLGLGCTGRVRIEYNGKKEKEEGVKNKEANDDNTLRKVAILSSNAGAGFRLESELCPEDFQAVQEGRATLVEEQHTRCANVSIVRYEFATNTDLLVSSFNINTNKWMLEDTVCCSLLAISPNPHIADSAELVSSTMAYSSPVKYLYKRLRFLGNKTISQAFTLIFLAVWHGFYSGYYINFLLEFLTIHTEKQFLMIVHRSIYADFLYGTLAGKILTTIAGKLHIFFLLSSPLVAFSLLRASLWIPVFNSVYWIGFIYLLWPLAVPLVKRLFPPKDPKPSTPVSN
nr:Membrane bound O acyl transferase MBOAT [Hymenolepis microstoma]